MMRKLAALFALWICAAADAKDWYDPTRYAFISGSAVPSLVVVDVIQGRQADTISLPIQAKILAASTDAPFLAFSDKIAHDIYLIHLKTGEIERFPMPSAVYRILFIPNTSKMFIVLEKNIAQLDYLKHQLTIIDRPFQNLYTRFYTIFSVYSQTIWVTQENTPTIARYRLTKPEAGWTTLNIGENRGLGAGAPSYEDRIIALNTYYAEEGIIYFPDSGKTLRTGAMHDSRALNERMVEPYIDNASRHVYFADKGGNIKIYDLAVSSQPIDLHIPFPPRQLKTGWLDQYLIVGGDEGLGIYRISDPSDRTEFTFGYEENIADMWVSGDSKLLLFGTERSRILMRYDLKNRRRLPDIELQGIAQIGQIRMNTTNTICY